MAYKDKNYLLERVVKILSQEPRGRFLDLGCGDGDLCWRAKELGFGVIACDVDKERFKYKEDIEFYTCDLNKELPFKDNTFDYITFLEVIEHLENPHFTLKEINRVLKSRGILILSTPNILNLKSRLRFLFEGSLEFFREPIIEQVINPKWSILAVHIYPYRFQELEYLLFKNNLEIKEFYTDLFLPAAKWLSFLIPLIKFQSYIKRKKSYKKGGVDYSRIHKVLLSPELLYGRHLIVKAYKK